jgi:hypothetical protein
VIGGVGTLGFGLRTQSLHRSYLDAPTASTYDQGIFARTMTNVSLGVAALGVAFVVVDLVAFARRPAVEAR